MVVFANVLQPLIDFFEAFLLFFHDSVGLGWGWSIVALTVVIRAALLPLTLRQTRSMYRMAQYAPEMKALQQKHKDDPQRSQREMMAFYRENKINPAASCLPAIAQLPVFLALFYMLQADLRQDICPGRSPGDELPCGPGGAAQFLFIPDLTDKATGGVLITLIVLYVASQVLSFLLSASPNMDRTQRLIFLALPLVFVAFIWNFPAGLLVYWITTNLWTIIQGLIVRRRLGHLRPPPPPPGSGGLSDLFKTIRGETAPTAPSRTGAGAVAVGAGSGAGAAQGAPSRPPAPPRKKKKRSGRRR